MAVRCITEFGGISHHCDYVYDIHVSRGNHVELSALRDWVQLRDDSTICTQTFSSSRLTYRKLDLSGSFYFK